MAMLQEQMADLGTDPLWWFWILIAVLFVAVIIYLVSRIGPSGPWFRGR